MNLRKFLYEVDKVSKEMTISELQAFIHENGRILPERFREEYIATLKSYSAAYEEEPDKVETGERGIDFKCKYEQMISQIEQISEGEISIGGELNYEYDDWYDNGDEFILGDPNGVTDIISDACEYVHRCVDCEEYVLGYQLAKILMALEISVEIEDGYEFYGTLRIKDLDEYGLGGIGYKSFVIDSLYCGYLVNDLKSRSDVLYLMMCNFGIKDMTLEMVLQNGEELTDIEDFLPEWIAYLGKRSEERAQGLLREALELSDDKEVLLDCARLYYNLHPSLYELYIDTMIKGKESLSDILKTGDEALEKIDVDYVIRSRIAKKMSALALKHNLKNKAENYWLEAFRSDTNVVNFMVLYTLSDDCGSYLDEIRKIYHSMYELADNSPHELVLAEERTVNHPSVDNIYMLAVLGGEFQYVKEHAMNRTAPLGWSLTFMKCGLAAFFLMLYEGDELQIAGKEMCRRVVSAVNFDKMELEKYSEQYKELDSGEVFWQCFLKWKQKNTIDEAERQNIIKWLDKTIKRRVKGIMEANRRNYYGECASFIAALGEVLESWGDVGAKQRVMIEYKNLYSRRSAFREELRRYGKIDTRKK